MTEPQSQPGRLSGFMSVSFIVVFSRLSFQASFFSHELLINYCKIMSKRAPVVLLIVASVFLALAFVRQSMRQHQRAVEIPHGEEVPKRAILRQTPPQTPMPPPLPLLRKLLSKNRPVTSSARGNLAEPGTITQNLQNRDWIKERFQFAKVLCSRSGTDY